ncbi:hypothetical protein GQ457_01G052250 [Hibiscus cannabinus]
MWDEVSSFVLISQGQGLIPFIGLPYTDIVVPISQRSCFMQSGSGKEIDCVTLSSLLFCNLHCFSLSFPFLNSSFARFELNKLLLKWRIN